MATEEQKQQRLLQVMNITMYGMMEGLWELFGESSFATVQPISEQILKMMEREAGLEITGEDTKDIILKVVRLMVDEFGIMSAGKPTAEGKKVSIACQECFMRQATAWLEAEGVRPFACIPMNVTAAALRRSGAKHRLLGRDWDPASQTCTIHFELL